MKNSFKDLTFEELVQKREELKTKLMDVRFKSVVSHVENPLQKRNLRRQISRLNSMIYNHPDVVGSDN